MRLVGTAKSDSHRGLLGCRCRHAHCSIGSNPSVRLAPGRRRGRQRRPSEDWSLTTGGTRVMKPATTPWILANALLGFDLDGWDYATFATLFLVAVAVLVF